MPPLAMTTLTEESLNKIKKIELVFIVVGLQNT